MIKLTQSEPYKTFFTFGTLCAAAGVAQWVLFYLGVVPKYPIETHSQFMISGFTLAFISGFLMTALPKMTGTDSAHHSEKFIAGILFLAFFISSLFEDKYFSYLASAGIFVFLLFFSRRIKKRDLSYGLLFIPLGLSLGFVGGTLIFLSSHQFLNFLDLGKRLFNEGFILNIVIGFGGRLIPVLTRKSDALSPTLSNGLTQRVLLFEAMVVNGSFFIEEFVDQSLGVGVRFLILIYILYKNFLFFSPISERSNLGIGVSVATLSFPICYLFVLLFPHHRPHLMHILYISGFAALTLLVSIRISYAHGGVSLEREKSSWAILWLMGAIFFAALVRVLGIIFEGPDAIKLYAIASMLFFGALFAWAICLNGVLFWEKK